MKRSRPLHPVLAGWFAAQFPGFTEIQKRALRFTTRGCHTLILAPTGSGKTLAAFLAVLSELAYLADAGTLGNAVRAIYVSPLKALGRDIERNLEAPLEAVNRSLPEARNIRMMVRTGDTSLSERARQQRRRPHLLITTPESLSSVLSQSGWRDAWNPVAMIVDEIHALAENKRGSLLALAMERLEARAAAPLLRIGVSATAWPLEAVTQLLCGTRGCEIAAVDARKVHHLEIAVPPPEISLPPTGYSPFRIAALAAETILASPHTTLAFTATRSAAERLGLALGVLLPDWEDRIAVHHGSIDRAARAHIEDGLASGRLKAVVCSTSLELGVDFQAVSQVLLIGAPRGVSRALQRLGRSGHRIGGIASGLLLPLSLPDLLECAALQEAVRAGHLDRLRVPVAPLDVLAQTILGMAVEREWGVDEAFSVIKRAGPYLTLSRDDFDAVLEYLAGGGRVLGGYGTYGKIVIAGGRFRVASRKVARLYYSNIGAISEELHIKVFAGGNRKLGEVEEGFLASLQPGEAFILGGKPVRVRQIAGDRAWVEPAAGERIVTPRWMGGRMPLSARLASEELRLRRLLRESWLAGGESACRKALVRQWGIKPAAAARAAAYVSRQMRAAPLPIDQPVQLERIRQDKATLLLFHVVAGRAVNRSLAWTLGHRFASWQKRRPSVVVNFDDHAFLISIDSRLEPGVAQLRTGFDPAGWRAALTAALAETETVGRRFRAIAEIGQLLPKRTLDGKVTARTASWSGSLLYQTLHRHEPGHPLVREAIREVMEDELDASNAEREAARIYETDWEVFDLPRPSPIALPLFASFQREVLLRQDPDRALEEVTERLYAEWGHAS